MNIGKGNGRRKGRWEEQKRKEEYSIIYNNV
jgi:hypothetical protein